jgi:tRNA dimethylallyltransferase
LKKKAWRKKTSNQQVLLNKLLIAIVGPTAVGKTAVALKLAEQLDTEILSADSRQFYREMEIGTAKPVAEELKKISHHFINNLFVHDEYNAAFLRAMIKLF